MADVTGHPNRRLTPAEIIMKMVRVSNTSFSGKIHDNILTIFQSLPLNEQKDLLRGLVCMNVSATTQVGYIPEILDSANVGRHIGITLADLGGGHSAVVTAPVPVMAIPPKEPEREKEEEPVTLAAFMKDLKSILSWGALFAGAGLGFFWLATSSAEENPHVAAYIKQVFDLLVGFL